MSISCFALNNPKVAFVEASRQAGIGTVVLSSPVGTNTGTQALAGGKAIGTGERWGLVDRKLCQFAGTKEA